jgi:hypothetical protein
MGLVRDERSGTAGLPDMKHVAGAKAALILFALTAGTEVPAYLVRVFSDL